MLIKFHTDKLTKTPHIYNVKSCIMYKLGNPDFHVNGGEGGCFGCNRWWGVMASSIMIVFSLWPPGGGMGLHESIFIALMSLNSQIYS